MRRSRAALLVALRRSSCRRLVGVSRPIEPGYLILSPDLNQRWLLPDDADCKSLSLSSLLPLCIAGRTSEQATF